MADKLERLYTVPLGDAYNTVRKKRAMRAVSILRAFVSRNMKTETVLLSNKLNSFIWQYSIEKPPRRVKIRAIKNDGKANVYLQDEKLEEKKEVKEEIKKDAKKDAKKDEDKNKTQQKDTEQKTETKSDAIKSEQKKNQEKQVSGLKQRVEQKSGIR